MDRSPAVEVPVTFPRESTAKRVLERLVIARPWEVEVPTTERAVAGVEVPMPTLPFDCTVNMSGVVEEFEDDAISKRSSVGSVDEPWRERSALRVVVPIPSCEILTNVFAFKFTFAFAPVYGT